MSNWTDFKAMLKDIKANCKSKVEQDDLPLEEIFGYKSVDDNNLCWHIKISDINSSLENIDSSSLFQIISTESGKEKLLEALNKDK